MFLGLARLAARAGAQSLETMYLFAKAGTSNPRVGLYCRLAFRQEAEAVAGTVLLPAGRRRRPRRDAGTRYRKPGGASPGKPHDGNIHACPLGHELHGNVLALRPGQRVATAADDMKRRRHFGRASHETRPAVSHFESEVPGAADGDRGKLQTARGDGDSGLRAVGNDIGNPPGVDPDSVRLRFGRKRSIGLGNGKSSPNELYGSEQAAESLFHGRGVLVFRTLD